MQGFNRYYPPDFDPQKHDTLNNYHGKHALGDRARKIDQGILITRFELPFNIWCGSCEAHIGMGVRYNAEKKKVGMYYSTPIYSFRCKCHLCGNWFEIRTDPKNTRYVVENGARQKNEDWDEVDNGGIVLNRKEDGESSDPFSQVEKKTNDQLAALATKDRLEELMEFSEARNSDPFTLSQRLRKTFRQEKAELIAKSCEDDKLRSKYSLPTGLKFNEPEVGSSDAQAAEGARRLIASRRAELTAKRRRLDAELGSGGSRSTHRMTPKAAQLANLKDQLVISRRRAIDPFISHSANTPRSFNYPKRLTGAASGSSKRLSTGSANIAKLPLASLSGYASD
ncbi:hypothetical protein O181_015537 [Austropuccinia psidii MF-1]|uniref:Coiled-coil domain-containing protein 130 n=1 Tax=Austropuccinia psidii MF-1 TaxID=1389203 RepID=A0A9Q3C2B1_9BASI|nr:hypothetical protein [Austropuccinia psidii MF-1]